MRNRLAGMRGYLCGAMDRTQDGGEQWRILVQKRLADLGIYWLDPTHKPIEIGIEDAEMRQEVEALKLAGQYDLASTRFKLIRAVDRRMVDISDFLIANIDLDIHACGTYDEITLANSQKKPIIVRMEQGKEYTPNWLLGMLPHEMVFSTWDQVVTYVRHVATDRIIQHYKRWWFFDFSMCRKFETEV